MQQADAVPAVEVAAGELAPSTGSTQSAEPATAAAAVDAEPVLPPLEVALADAATWVVSLAEFLSAVATSPTGPTWTAAR